MSGRVVHDKVTILRVQGEDRLFMDRFFVLAEHESGAKYWREVFPRNQDEVRRLVAGEGCVSA